MKIKAIGFDLDGTLYPPNPAIDERIRAYTCEEVAKILARPYVEVRREYDEYYAKFQSGSATLRQFGIMNGKEIVQGALEKVDISNVLRKDVQLRDMLGRLSRGGQHLFLVTSNKEEAGLKKLRALGLDPAIFNPAVYSEAHLYREDGSAFRYVSQTLDVPFGEMMFVGDREQVDIVPAKNLGITTAIVNSRSNAADFQLNNYIYDLEEVLRRIEQ